MADPKKPATSNFSRSKLPPALAAAIWSVRCIVVSRCANVCIRKNGKGKKALRQNLWVNGRRVADLWSGFLRDGRTTPLGCERKVLSFGDGVVYGRFSRSGHRPGVYVGGRVRPCFMFLKVYLGKMARPLRLEFAGAIYHLMLWSNARQPRRAGYAGRNALARRIDRQLDQDVRLKNDLRAIQVRLRRKTKNKG